jgi:hypothetical protein
MRYKPVRLRGYRKLEPSDRQHIALLALSLEVLCHQSRPGENVIVQEEAKESLCLRYTSIQGFRLASVLLPEDTKPEWGLVGGQHFSGAIGRAIDHYEHLKVAGRLGLPTERVQAGSEPLDSVVGRDNDA